MMKGPSFDFVQATGVRRAVVPAGDIRADIAFQNDINGLLARLEGENPPLTALGWIQEPVSLAAAVAGDRTGGGQQRQQPLRVLRGGLGVRMRREMAQLEPIGFAARRG